MKGPVRTLLVEDQEITRFGLRSMLEKIPEIDLVAEAADGNSGLKAALAAKPHLILMDIGLPGLDGIEATRAIKAALSTKVIIMTCHDNAESALAALSAGADAYCLSDVSLPQLASAVESVMSGAVWLDPKIAHQVIEKLQPQCSPNAARSHDGNFSLSAREYQVLELVVDGLSNQQIADRLHLSCETVKTHMCHLLEKLRVADRTQAAVKALREGMFSSNNQGEKKAKK